MRVERMLPLDPPQRHPVGIGGRRAVPGNNAMVGAAEAYSGARFERVVLTDGRRLVLKHLAPNGDWLTRITAGAGRMRLLGDSETLADVEATLDHTIVAMVPSNGTE